MTMHVMSRNDPPPSTLNPNAPMFVPAAYRDVEDFSDQWWSLVHTSPWFRDYWLRECFYDPQTELDCLDNYDPFLPDEDELFVDGEILDDRVEEQKIQKDLIPLSALKWRSTRAVVEPPKHLEKAPKIVNVKVHPRPIQQPR